MEDWFVFCHLHYIVFNDELLEQRLGNTMIILLRSHLDVNIGESTY